MGVSIGVEHANYNALGVPRGPGPSLAELVPVDKPPALIDPLKTEKLTIQYPVPVSTQEKCDHVGIVALIVGTPLTAAMVSGERDCLSRIRLPVHHQIYTILLIFY